MKNHRTVSSTSLKILDIQQPFSNFDYVDSFYKSLSSIRRLFSLSRTLEGKTLIIENISPEGVILDENKEILNSYSDYKMKSLQRLSFWKSSFKNKKNLKKQKSIKLIGYAIVKYDHLPSKGISNWHVFESIFSKYPHHHNCIPGAKIFKLCIGNKIFSLKGVMYCQQNGINKACAQVALRSLCSLHIPDTKLSYKKINTLALNAKGPFDPAKGLESSQIRAVLDGLGINYKDLDYTASDINLRKDLPYQKFLYSGIESGGGALLGFQFAGPQATGRHMIPFYGHTFNQDTWVSKADLAYFKVGEQTKYITSETWVSSFIGHDDNFGSNFCIPRNYVLPDQAEYVVEILKNNVKYSGIYAEAFGVKYLYWILPELNIKNNNWLKRLAIFTRQQEVVLRAISMTKSQYINNLKKIKDWNNNKEDIQLIDVLTKYLPSSIWVVEVSIPQLFPVNQRKLGEIVLDATVNPSDTKELFGLFLLSRLPGIYLFFQKIKNSKPQFIELKSRLKSHTPLINTH